MGCSGSTDGGQSDKRETERQQQSDSPQRQRQRSSSTKDTDVKTSSRSKQSKQQQQQQQPQGKLSDSQQDAIELLMQQNKTLYRPKVNFLALSNSLKSTLLPQSGWTDPSMSSKDLAMSVRALMSIRVNSLLFNDKGASLYPEVAHMQSMSSPTEEHEEYDVVSYDRGRLASGYRDSPLDFGSTVLLEGGADESQLECVRVGSGPSSRRPLPTDPATMAAALGVSVDDLALMIERVVLCLDCCVSSVFEGTMWAFDDAPPPAASKRSADSDDDSDDDYVRGAPKLDKSVATLLEICCQGDQWGNALHVYRECSAKAENDASLNDGLNLFGDDGPPEALTSLVDVLDSDRTLPLLMVAQRCVETGIELISFLLGGRKSFGSLNGTASKSLQVPHFLSVSKAICMIYRFVADPSKGMEAVMTVEEQCSALGSLFIILGVVPPTCYVRPSSLRPDDDHSLFVGWTSWLPFPLIAPQASAVIANLAALLRKQQRLTMRGIERSSIIEYVCATFAKSGLAQLTPKQLPSAKIFPAFIGEAGEGHGPRKEFFDCCAETLSSSHAAPKELREYRLVAHCSCGKSTISVALPDKLDASEARTLLGDGNIITVFTKSRSELKAQITFVKFDMANRMVSVRLDSPAPEDDDGAVIRFVSVRQVPCLELSAAKPFAWFNGAIPDTVPKSSGDPVTVSSERENTLSPQWIFNRYFVFGWIMGAAVVNGVSLSLPLPLTFFKILKILVAKGESPVSDKTVLASITEQDFLELDDSNLGMINRVRGLSGDELRQYIEDTAPIDCDPGQDEEALARKFASTFMKKYPKTKDAQERYIRKYMIENHLWEQVKNRFQVVAEGFRASTIPFLASFPSWRAEDLQLMVCGNIDSVTKDFEFIDHFDIVFDVEFARYRHSFIFKKIILEVLTAQHLETEKERVEFKRSLLKFITGRTLLPPHLKSESIKIGTSDCCFTVREFTNSSKRLPTAHTCGNVFEVPNYIEGLLFELNGVFFREQCMKSSLTTQVSDDDKNDAWSALPASTRSEVRESAYRRLVSKLSLAIANADTYELDDDIGGGGGASEEHDDNTIQAGEDYELPEEPGQPAEDTGGGHPFAPTSSFDVTGGAAASGAPSKPQRTTEPPQVIDHHGSRNRNWDDDDDGDEDTSFEAPEEQGGPPSARNPLQLL